MKEKRTAANTGVHDDPKHERWTWFAQESYCPPQDDVDVVREARYNDSTHGVYYWNKIDGQFAFIGYVNSGHISKAEAAAQDRGYVLDRDILFLALPMPANDPSAEYDDEPPSGWNSAWGEDPRK